MELESAVAEVAEESAAVVSECTESSLSEERLATYLPRWTALMSEENRLRSVRWILTGSDENEAMVGQTMRNAQDHLLAKFPGLESRLFTNCRDVDGWVNSYVVHTWEAPQCAAGHVHLKSIFVTVAMYQEEGLAADLYIRLYWK
jgi:hypothetical protein